MTSAPFILFGARDLSRWRQARIELRRRGARASAVTTARDLLQVASTAHPDVIIMDDDLDPLAITQTARLVRHRCPEAQIALLVSHPAQRVREASGELDLIYCGIKPISKDALLDAIGNTLKGKLKQAARSKAAARRVLCVDDDTFYLESLGRILQRHGYCAVTYDQPEAALDALADAKPDLALLDIMMPGMNGLDMADEIRRRSAKIPIVLLSARTADRDIADAYRRGASYYITKPCEPQTVLNIIDYLIGDLDPTERELLEAHV